MECDRNGGAWFRALNDFGAAPKFQYIKTWTNYERRRRNRRRGDKNRGSDDVVRQYYLASDSFRKTFQQNGGIFSEYETLRGKCKARNQAAGTKWAEDLLNGGVYPSGTPQALDEEHQQELQDIQVMSLNSAETATQAVCEQLEARFCDLTTTASERDASRRDREGSERFQNGRKASAACQRAQCWV